MFTRQTASRTVQQVIVASLFVFSSALTNVLAQEARIDPGSPINGITYSLDNTRKFLVINVALRQLPTDFPADQGILLKDFRMGNLRSVSDGKVKSLSNTSDALNKLYRIEISDTPSEDDVRLVTKWDKFSFVVMASYGAANRPYESPQFTIVRNIQVPTIKIGTPKWQAENVGGIVTRYLAVPVTPSESMKVNIVMTDSNGVVAQKTNLVIGGGDTTNVELAQLPNRIIATGIKYTTTVTSASEGTSVTQTSEWTPPGFIDNYRLSDASERFLSSFPAVETNKVKILVDTLVPGNSLRLVAEGLAPEKIKPLPHTASHWEFEVDLTGVTQKTVPFYFDGEGGSGQVFVGNDRRYFLNLNNELKVVGTLTISFNSDNEMVVNYTLNRRADSHRLRLAVPGILELTDLPTPVRVGETNEYNVKAKTSVTQLLTRLAAELKNDKQRSFPVKFKLIESEGAADKPFTEFAIYAYGVTTGDYLGKIAAISELVGTSKKLTQVEARTVVLQKLGLSTMPTESNEAQTVDKLVTLLSTVENKDDRRKSFWSQLAGYALKIIPPLVGIPVVL